MGTAYTNTMSGKSKNEVGSAKVGARRSRVRQLAWRLPPLSWVLSAGRPLPVDAPSRILVASACSEALILAKSFPAAEVVVIDPTEKSVRSLRLSALRRRLQNVTTETALLDQPALAELTGRNFDLILVLDYVPQNLEAVFENLAACAKRQGSTLFIKVPSASHPLLRLPEILPAFGLDMEDLTEAESNSQPLLPLISALGGDEGPGTTIMPAVPLKTWMSEARACGFHYAASLHTPPVLSRALSMGGTEALLSYGRESLAVLLDLIARPASCQLVFSTTPCAEPPWRDPEALGTFRPIVQFWPRASLPKQEAPFNRVMSVDIQIQKVLPPLKMQLSSYMLELLRNSDGTRTLRDLMADIPHEVQVAELAPALYFFFHASILNLFPPE